MCSLSVNIPNIGFVITRIECSLYGFATNEIDTYYTEIATVFFSLRNI